MLKLLKDACADALELAGYQELATWLSDAPRKAVREAVRIIMQALGFKGKVDQGTADQITKLMKSTPAKADSGVPEEPDDSNLTQYLIVVNSIIAAGSSRPHLLLLDGFFHTDQCASLWDFDREKKDIELDIFTPGLEEPSIFFHNSGVKIYLFDKLEREVLLKFNEQFGANPDLYPTEELNTSGKPLVRDIFEHRVEAVAVTMKQVRSGRRGQALKPEENKLTFAIPGDHKGVQLMLSSLRPALEARAKSAQALKNAIANGLLAAGKKKDAT